MNETIAEMLTRHEGLRLKPYRCTAGKLSIGIGRNLDDQGISVLEAVTMLKNDIAEKSAELGRRLPWALDLDAPRFNVLVMMAFNLGINGLLRFKVMLAAMKRRDWPAAAAAALDSPWATKQVGKRAVELSEIIRTGEM